MRAAAADNATTCAKAPRFWEAWNNCPHALLQASEGFVGLPEGQIGNSEVGHMNLGAGRVVFQDLPRIDRALATGELAKNPALAALIAKLRETGGTCHLMGLASPGGVHAHQDHMVALAQFVTEAGVQVALHAFLDGRDVPPESAAAQIGKLAADLASVKGARIATLCGRYHAMDRDKRWERVAKAYDLLVSGEGAHANDPVAAIEASYKAGVTDEFVAPVCLNGYAGMKDGDGVLFANFRSDRAREILTALLDPAFDGFARKRRVSFAGALGMVEYSDDLKTWMKALFPPKALTNGFGEIVAKAGLTQLRIAETEKYPHVTFFFNGGREEPYAGEERVMVPSPKVATYDLKPEMAAFEVTDKVLASIEGGRFDFILLNYANADMVGHTGSLPAAIKAVEDLDACLGRLFDAIKAADGMMLVTADHGNCELMADPATHGPHTAHTLNRVPLILFNGPSGAHLKNGKLADVAPTLLALMGLGQPAEMDGKSLLDNPDCRG
jgi:2,3-bisphosphoglycerate-independent phosphoglycerate mutase